MYVLRKLYAKYPKRGNTSNHSHYSPHWDKTEAIMIEITFWHLFLKYGDKCTGFYREEK